jgi:hypothetical protein
MIGFFTLNFWSYALYATLSTELIIFWAIFSMFTLWPNNIASNARIPVTTDITSSYAVEDVSTSSTRTA